MIYWTTIAILGAIALTALWGLWGLIRRDLKARYPYEFSRFVLWKTNRRLDKAERRLARDNYWRDK